MCIIMIKPKGATLPSKGTFKTMFENNPDGAGFMYVKDGQVVIDKGYMGYKNMYKKIRKLLESEGDRNIVVHFRIGTSAKNDQKTTHPYPISPDTDLLQKLKMTTDLAMVHNGIISGYDDKHRPDLNDTQIYIRDFLSILKGLNRQFYLMPRVEDMLEDMTGSKLCFLDTKDRITTVGHFYEEDGCLYSNTSYKESIYSYWQYEDDIRFRYLDNYEEEKPKDDITFRYLEIGDRIALQYGGYVNVYSDNEYIMDSEGYIYNLNDNGEIEDVLYSNTTVYDKNDEEVYI